MSPDAFREGEWLGLWDFLRARGQWTPCSEWKRRIGRHATLGDFLRHTRRFGAYRRETVRWWLRARGLIRERPADVPLRAPLSDDEIADVVRRARALVRRLDRA